MWKVMIVDDEQTARLGLERIISETMPELIVTTKAENGMDALEKIEKRQPDIVISDISMPVMDGIELSRQVRKQYPQIVMIMLTAYDNFSYVQQCLTNQVFDYVLKPIEEDAFLKVMEKAVSEAAHRKQRLVHSKLYSLYTQGGMSLIYGIVTTQRFAHAVSKGDTPQIREHVNQIFSSLDKRSMDHQTLMLAIQEIYGTTVNMLESRVFAVDPSLRELNIDASMSEEAIQEKFLSNILAISQNNIQERARSQRVRLIKRYIIDHFEEDISLQHLADEFNMNPNYLSEIFKEETGQNFRSFLVEIRIERAIELMKDRRYQIQQIAEMVGYPDCTYFNKAFKRVTGIAPGEFRRTLML